MLTRLYHWIMRLAAGPRAEPALAAVSFAESSFFPIPPDVMLLPMCLAQRRRAFRFAAVCTIASVLGGILGYGIGFSLVETVGKPILDFYGKSGALDEYRMEFAASGLLFILAKGVTPIPYKLVTIAAGAAAFDPLTFVLASIVTRGARFFLVAALLWRFGETIRPFIEKRLALLTWIFLIVLVLGFLGARFLL
jgi:membrane protein YqaA with SNARE-associated domain